VNIEGLIMIGFSG